MSNNNKNSSEENKAKSVQDFKRSLTHERPEPQSSAPNNRPSSQTDSQQNTQSQ